MKGDLVSGHEWSLCPRVSPAVKMAISVTGPHHPSLRELQQWDWVLDYEWLTYGQIRVEGPKSEWLPRLPHTAHLYPPGRRFWEDTRQERGERSSMWVHISGGEAAGLDRLVDPVRGYGRFTDEGKALGSAIRRGVLAGSRHGEGGFWLAQSALGEAIHLLHRSEPSPDGSRRIFLPSQEGSDLPFRERVLSLLKRDLSQKVTVEGMARELGVSPSTLAHRYRAEAGEPPLATLASLRIAHAKRLISRGYPLKVVAELTGFSDPYHFSKAFRRHAGIPPSQFRAQGPGQAQPHPWEAAGAGPEESGAV